MKHLTWGVRLLMIFAVSCTIFQPTPSVVERNYEDGSVTKSVKVGHDLNAWPPLQETQEHARERLIADIRRGCPKYTLLGEGTKTQDREVVGSRFNTARQASQVNSTTETDVYLWIRYRCNK